MKTNKSKWLLSFLLVFLSACSQESDFWSNEDQSSNEGQEITVQLGVALPQLEKITLETRGGNELPLIESLRLLVFDEKNQFLYSRPAILGQKQQADKHTYYPAGSEGIKEVYTYSVSLFQSSEPRTIHFVANYDWSDFEQDYFLQGLDAGQVLGHLTSSDVAYWRMIELPSLHEKTLQNTVVKLLRNQAQLSVEDKATDFELTGFTIYNGYDRGTVVPFSESGKIELAPNQPTIPADFKLLEPQATYSLLPQLLFERTNGGENPLFVLVKGKYKNTAEETYYKLDLKKFNEQTGVSSLYDIVRNTWYILSINKVTSPGYKTAKEAIQMPAGNNIFASVELEDFYKISDGINELEVTKLGDVLVHPSQVFTTELFFTEGLEHVKLYPSWSDDDPYLEAYQLVAKDSKTGTLQVRVKEVPSQEYINHTIDVVAKTTAGGYITRKIKLLVRSPYEFDGKIEEVGDHVELSFQVPPSMSKAAFPFDVWVETDQMTPLQISSNKLLLVIKDGKYYYRYTVKDETLAGSEIKIPFNKNDTQIKVEHLIPKLSSVYYNDEEVYPKIEGYQGFSIATSFVGKRGYSFDNIIRDYEVLLDGNPLSGDDILIKSYRENSLHFYLKKGIDKNRKLTLGFKERLNTVRFISGAEWMNNEIAKVPYRAEVFDEGTWTLKELMTLSALSFTNKLELSGLLALDNNADFQYGFTSKVTASGDYQENIIKNWRLDIYNWLAYGPNSGWIKSAAFSYAYTLTIDNFTADTKWEFRSTNGNEEFKYTLDYLMYRGGDLFLPGEDI